MADITITTEQLADLAPVLTEVLDLTPPPTAKGRYALAKVGAKVDPAFKVFAEQDAALAKRVATTDEKGAPVMTALPGGQVHFNVRPEMQDEYTAERKAILAEPVVLTGVRQITHAELGACPITARHEMILIECGLLEDKEPA